MNEWTHDFPLSILDTVHQVMVTKRQKNAQNESTSIMYKFSKQIWERERETEGGR